MEKNHDAKKVEGMLTKMLGKVTREIPEERGMNQATKMMLAKIAEADEEMEKAKDKRVSLRKANQILEEYSSILEEYLGNMIARNIEVDMELEATLEEIAKIQQENPYGVPPGPSKETEGVKFDIPPQD